MSEICARASQDQRSDEREPRGWFEGFRVRSCGGREVEGAALPGLLNGGELLCRG